MRITYRRGWLKYRELVKDLVAVLCLGIMLTAMMWAAEPVSMLIRAFMDKN